jgi:hypothetical protein
MESQSTWTNRERKKRPREPSKHQLNLPPMKKRDSESGLDAISPIHTLTPEAARARALARQRLMRLFNRPMRIFKSIKSQSPWRSVLLAVHGVDFPSTPGDPTKEVDDLLDPNSNILEKYTSRDAPHLRELAAKDAAQEDMRRKARYEHMKGRPEYDAYSTEDEPDSDSDSGSCSE